jgi:CDP-4-dehydro-6-deoxyglucose reductase, E3
MIRSEPFDARLIASRNLSPAVRELIFERQGGEPFLFAPGQWVNLLIPSPDGELKRAYSIAGAPALGSPRFAVAVTRVANGAGSRYLHDLPEGATLRAVGPQGLFTRAADDASPSLFVGTGTGVTPLLSMMEAAIAGSSRAPLWLLFGARREEDILYREELERWASGLSNVRYAVTLSQPHPGWSGLRGYVQAHVHALLAELRAEAAPLEPHVYICGLDRMVSVVRDLLRGELALPRKHVHAERYD